MREPRIPGVEGGGPLPSAVSVSDVDVEAFGDGLDDGGLPDPFSPTKKVTGLVSVRPDSARDRIAGTVKGHVLAFQTATPDLVDDHGRTLQSGL